MPDTDSAAPSPEETSPATRKHSLVVRNGDTCELREIPGQGFLCPICGAALASAPYDPVTGVPSRKWCACCENQFGWDDLISSDAPAGAKRRRWQELREEWSQHTPHETVAKQLGQLTD